MSYALLWLYVFSVMWGAVRLILIFSDWFKDDEFETHECVLCKRDVDASYYIPKPPEVK